MFYYQGTAYVTDMSIVRSTHFGNILSHVMLIRYVINKIGIRFIQDLINMRTCLYCNIQISRQNTCTIRTTQEHHYDRWRCVKHREVRNLFTVHGTRFDLGSYSNFALKMALSWNSTGEIGRIGRHRAETRRHFNIRFFGPIPPDASDFPGGIPALDADRA